jgi:hypothetical protein
VELGQTVSARYRNYWSTMVRMKCSPSMV